MRLLPTPPVRITSGEVVFDGDDLTQLPARRVRDIRSERISMIFQDPLTSLDPVFTVGQVMTEVIRTHRDATKAEARDMSVEILRAVGLPAPEERFDSYPHELSGGMRQRVMIATALVLDPEILIADEPTTALDVTVQAQILERLRSEQQDRHMSMLLITHDLAVVASIADRVAVMYAGEIVEEAPVDELFSNPRHPYTQGLLRALPTPVAAPGAGPDPGAGPAHAHDAAGLPLRPPLPPRAGAVLERPSAPRGGDRSGVPLLQPPAVLTGG